jgi:hypothetical protein
MEDPVVIGPTVPGLPGGVIYQITLSNGSIATDPSAFARPTDERFVSPVVARDGRVLIELPGQRST